MEKRGEEMEEQKIIQKQLIKNMLLNLITFSIIFSFLGIIIYTQVSHSLYRSSDEELLNNKNKVAIMQEFRNKDKAPLDNINIPEEPKRIKEGQMANPRLVYIFRDENGNIIEEAGKYQEDYFKDVKFDKNQMERIYETTINGSYQYRGINYQIQKDGHISYVQVFINVDAEQTIIQDFTKTLVLSIVICIAISIIASYILSKKTLRPIILSWKKQTEFVQNASHELRTPLTIIQAKQELLLEEPNSKIIDKAEEITIALNETKRLAKLVKDLMVLAREDTQQTSIQKEVFDLDSYIKAITKPYEEFAQMEEKKFLLNLNYKKEIHADKSKFHQLLVILLDNAIKYTEEKEVIEVTTYEKDNRCMIEVKDTGIGISKEGMKHVFDRFYREDKARSRQTGGTGLGLSIADYIVKQHKGVIKVEQNMPKGTIFSIKLPK